MRPRWIHGGILAASLFVAGSAAAQDATIVQDAATAQPSVVAPRALTPAEEEWLAPPSKPTHDVDVVKTGAIVTLVTGGAAVLVGAITWAVSVSMNEQVCGGIAGCFERPDASASDLRKVGTGLTGIGLGMALVSGAYLAFSSAFPLAEDVEFRNDRTATAGLLLLSISTGLLAGGVLYSELSDPLGSAYEDGWPFFLSAAATGIAGIPLFAVGIRVQDDYDKARRRLDKVKRSRPKKKSEGDVNLGMTPGGVMLRTEF